MKKILIVEGNLREENQSFTDGGIKTHTESLKDSINYFTKDLEIVPINLYPNDAKSNYLSLNIYNCTSPLFSFLKAS